MRLVGKSEVTTRDLGGELQFTVTREDGLVETIAGPALLAYFLFMAWKANNYIFLAFGAIGAAWLLSHWLQGRETELRVTSKELVATGNLGRMFSTEVRVAALDVVSLGWDSPGEGDNRGLYLKRGWGRVCVLPGLNREQAADVVYAIYRKFPEIGMEEYNSGSFLFGTNSGLTTLGLSKPAQENPKAKSD